MQVSTTVGQMQALAQRAGSEGLRTGLVPTMGCLHAGHMSLVKAAREICDRLVVSLFVNPAQFGPGEDFDRYPRAAERDSRLCREAGVDILFAPSGDEIYAPDHSVFVEETALSSGLCGELRPGHFRGVTTVVAKLFNAVQPQVAVFGRKDAQQACVIKRMVRDLNFPVEIVVAPIVREDDGLAMSSRNAYLSATQREQARCLVRSLRSAESLFREGERDTGVLRAGTRAVLESAGVQDIEYVAVVDSETLEPVTRVERSVLVAVAARIGTTRLIDNTILDPSGGR